MAKLGYTWYPKDWGNSERVFELNLEERGLYREIIDMAMLSDNNVDYRPDMWARKYNTSSTQITNCVDKLKELKLIEVKKTVISVPSCEARLNLIRGGRRGGQISRKPKKGENIIPPTIQVTQKYED